MSIRVLILGGGVAGLSALRKLSRYRHEFPDLRIALVNRHRWNLFAPLLADIVSGRINPQHITFPLEPFCRSHHAEFIHAEVARISLAEKKVDTSAGTWKADFLIICLGCETNYYGNENMRLHAPGLKTVQEGIAIRHQAKQVIRNRRSTADGKGHVVVVGGGYSGFEVASHLAYLCHNCTGLPFALLPGEVDITIVEKAPAVLSNTSPGVQHWAEHLIRGYGVEVKTNVSAVAFESERDVRMSDGSVLRDAMVVWTAGVEPGPVIAALDIPRTRGRRMKVDEFLRVEGYDDVFAAGDVAGAVPPGHEDPLRLAWHFSSAAGSCAAQNVVGTIRKKPLAVYRPRDPGYVVPLAPGFGAGNVLGRELHGRLPFLLHYALSVYYSHGLKKQLNILADLGAEMISR